MRISLHCSTGIWSHQWVAVVAHLHTRTHSYGLNAPFLHGLRPPRVQLVTALLLPARPDSLGFRIRVGGAGDEDAAPIVYLASKLAYEAWAYHHMAKAGTKRLDLREERERVT